MWLLYVVLFVASWFVLRFFKQHKHQSIDAQLHDEKLFEEPPPREDCPICLLPLPLNAAEIQFKTCCGKLICYGCIYAMCVEAMRKGKKEEEVEMCPYCRKRASTSDEERVKGINKLMEKGNGNAFYNLSGFYAQGINGMQQDMSKANELLLKAGVFGCAEAYCKLGNSYHIGQGVEIDKKKAKHYWELAAMKEDVSARNNLGLLEGKAGNHHRAMKHFILEQNQATSFLWIQLSRGLRKGL